MLNSRCCKQNKQSSQPQAVDSFPKRITQFCKSTTAEDLLRRFSSRLAGLIGPQGVCNLASEEPAGSWRQSAPRRRGGTATNSPALSLIPLQLASLCLDCEMITPAHTRCTACGSVALLSIANTLSHPPVVQLPRENALAISDIAYFQMTCCGSLLQST